VPKQQQSTVPYPNRYLELGKFGAIVGLCEAGATNLRRLQADQVTRDEALFDTLRTGVAAGLATAAAGFVANQFSPTPSLLATLATGTAIMYILNTETSGKTAPGTPPRRSSMNTAYQRYPPYYPQPQQFGPQPNHPPHRGYYYYSAGAQPLAPGHAPYPGPPQGAMPPGAYQAQQSSPLLNFSNDRFLKGLLIGAAATYPLTNESVQRTMIKGAVKAWNFVQGGVEEIKERFHDAEAELHASAVVQEESETA